MRKYNTKQKQLILEYLKENKDKCLSASDIKMHFDSNNQKIGQTTIYRYLLTLENDGKVMKYINSIDNSASYQYIEKDCHLHFHLKCINCEDIIHLDCLQLKELEHHITNKHHFEMDNSKTIIYGLCSKCKERG